MSCSNSPGDGLGEDELPDTETTIAVLPPVAPPKDSAHLANRQTGNIILLSFEKGSRELEAYGHLDSGNSRVTCYLDVKQGTRLTAEIETESGRGNIRFNQIFLPNGQSDGPFGKSLDYPLSERGLYKMVIAASQMADSAYVGRFSVRVRVE